MKNQITVILLTLIITGCSQKTHILDNYKGIKQIKNLTDSTGEKKTQTVDRSLITTVRDIDTTILTTGKPLTGYIKPSSGGVLDTIVVRLENNDLSLYLETNKTTGITKAIATPKNKNTIIKIHEKTIQDNDINITSYTKSNLKAKSATRLDSVVKHNTYHTEPVVSKGIKLIIIWLLIVVTVAGIAFYLFKKFSVIGIIMAWIKKCFNV